MDQERLSFIALHRIPGIGDFLVKQLVSYCGSAEAVFKTPPAKLMKIPGVGELSVTAIRTCNTFAEAEKELRKAEKEEVDLVVYTDKRYPHRLKTIEDAPALLYIKGNQNLNVAKTVGIVGTRQATE